MSRQSDSTTIQNGVSSLVLMENAARQIERLIMEMIQGIKDPLVLFVCGPGNNGADGLAAARLLMQAHGAKAVCLLNPQGKLSEDEAIQKKAALPYGVIVDDFAAFDQYAKDACLIVDGLFGSGLSRDIQEPYAGLMGQIAASGKPVLAIDIASGIDGTTGKKLSHAIKADATAALDTLKEGHLRNDGPAFSGQVHICEIGIPDEHHDHSFVRLDEDYAASLMPKRPVNGHKGTFGSVLLIGGSFQMQGALNMAANACFRTGIGLLRLYTPKSAARAIAAKNDLAMIIPAEEERGFFADLAVVPVPEMIKSADLVGLGNGMGQGKGAMIMSEVLLESDIALLVDADGINCLARKPQMLERTAPTILTPHVKEFSRLSRQPVSDILADPIGCARKFCSRYPNVVLVLKSSQTIVACRNQMAWLNRSNSALAKGGSGDVLSGMISGFAACANSLQEYFEAACLGVYVHNAASFENPKIDPAFFTPQDLIAGMNGVLYKLRSLSFEASA